jgi:hypothetical protein
MWPEATIWKVLHLMKSVFGGISGFAMWHLAAKKLARRKFIRTRISNSVQSILVAALKFVL